MVYNCTIKNCVSTIELKDSVSSNFKYVCKNHTVSKDDVRFQSCQFDREEEFNKVFDVRKSDGTEIRSGYQIIIQRQHEGDIPEWARSDEEIRKILVKAFPKLDKNENERLRAGQWARVIYLYYRMKNTFSQVAEDMGVHEKLVRNILQRISFVVLGLSASGKPRLRRRGRPRKS